MSETGIPPDVTDAWGAARSPFSEWVRGVSAAVDGAGLRTVYVARHLGTTVATLDGVLQLGLLDEASLNLLDEAIPQTAYLQLAACSAAEITEIVAALRAPTEDGLAPSERVSRILRASRGAPIGEQIAELPAEVFAHFAKKAVAYDLLTKTQRKALGDFASWRKRGKTLTIKQAAFAQSMLIELRNRGAIRTDSPDSDQDKCDQVLHVIGG